MTSSTDPCSKKCQIRYAGGPQNFAMGGYFNSRKYSKKEIRKDFFVGAEKEQFRDVTKKFFAYVKKYPCKKPAFYIKEKDELKISFKRVSREVYEKYIKKMKEKCANCVQSIGLY